MDCEKEKKDREELAFFGSTLGFIGFFGGLFLMMTTVFMMWNFIKLKMYNNTALHLQQITAQVINDAKSCSLQNGHFDDTNAKCKFQAFNNNTMCTCVTTEHTLKLIVHATATCSNTNGKISCNTTEKLHPFNVNDYHPFMSSQ